MRFKELTENEILYIKGIYKDKSLPWDERMKLLMARFGVGERTIRRWCSNKLGLKERVDIEVDTEVISLARTKAHNKEKKRFLITSAQSATPVHKNFLKNLEVYADYIDAEILVIPFRYKNPTSVFTDEQDNNEWWDENITKYLTLNRHNLNKSISVLSDVKIQPTSSRPLEGLEGMTGDHSSVVGHPRLELKSIPVLNELKPKIMFTTGACTLKNYTSSKAGAKGSFHHSLGFSIIEIKDEETFFFRQVSANEGGNFIDLFY